MISCTDDKRCIICTACEAIILQRQQEADAKVAESFKKATIYGLENPIGIAANAANLQSDEIATAIRGQG